MSIHEVGDDNTYPHHQQVRCQVAKGSTRSATKEEESQTRSPSRILCSGSSGCSGSATRLVA